MKIVKNTLTREATSRGYRVSFMTYDASEIDKALASDKELRAEIKEILPRRSLSANNYLWVLCDKIADALQSTKEKIYQRAIREVGVFSDFKIKREALETFMAHWNSNGIGYFCEVHDSDLADENMVRAYYGSHTYNTKEMARLIDYIVEDAQVADIEVATPDELARMKQEWR